MKLTKQATTVIWKFARERIGGFGMRLELAEQVFYRGDEQIQNHNLLTPHDKGSRDLWDVSYWNRKEEFELVDGYCWLDFHVHDKEELKGHVQALIDRNGNVVRLWVTWANEIELNQLIEA